MKKYTHTQAGASLGTTAARMRKIKFLGFRPDHEGRWWSERQILALHVHNAAKAGGADPAACQSALEIFAACNIEAVRASCSEGKPYHRLMGPVAEQQLVAESAAFHSDLLKAATRTRTPYVVIDVGSLLRRIDGIDQPQLNESLCEGAAI
jgi:hypothetical protein